MKWSSAVSDSPSLDDAFSRCLSTIREDFGSSTPDLVVAFVSAHHSPDYELLPELVTNELGDCLFLGCSGGGVIGSGREVEDRPGLAITAATLPDVELVPFRVDDNDLPDEDAPPERWESLVGTPASTQPNFLLLVDPWTMASERLLAGLDFAFPTGVKIGGMASGAHQSGENALYLSGDTYRSGAVGVSMRGAIIVDTVVAQGCRPIGEPVQITACHQNVILELDGGSPMEVLRRTHDGLSDRDRQLVQHSLFLGVVMDGLNDAPQLGDFLIRNIVGVDHQRGAIAVSASLQEGQVVQFHLRDAETSAEDLDVLLTKYAVEHPIYEETGALLFSCLGRGSYLYGRPDHDTDMFRDKVSNMPLTGFFCNGEIGPVGNATYLHGYTSSFGIFRPKP